MANGHGGSRPGSGRKEGSLNQRRTEIAEQLAAAKCDPAKGLADIAKKALAGGDLQLAATCFKELLPFVYPKLKMSDTSVRFDAADLAERIKRAKERAHEIEDRGGVALAAPDFQPGQDVAEVVTGIQRPPNGRAPQPKPEPKEVARPQRPVPATRPAPAAPRLSNGRPKWRQPISAQPVSGRYSSEYDPYE